jgi:hypothetical protein
VKLNLSASDSTASGGRKPAQEAPRGHTRRLNGSWSHGEVPSVAQRARRQRDASRSLLLAEFGIDIALTGQIER